MGTFSRLFFGLLTLATCSIFFGLSTIERIATAGGEQLTSNANGHAALLGTLAGIIAAIVVIFLTLDMSTNKQASEAQDNPGQQELIDSHNALKSAATGVFLTAFLLALLSSFQYSTFAGFPVVWKSQVLLSHGTDTSGEFPSLLFNFIGIQYFLTVYLTFYGLVLTVQYFTRDRLLSGLVAFLLIVTFAIGSSWVFLDFVAYLPKDAAPFDPLQVSVIYCLPSAVVWFIWMLPWWRPHPRLALTLLFGAVVIALISSIVISYVYSLGSCIAADEVTHDRIVKWTNQAVSHMPWMLSLIFVLFTYHLNYIFTRWPILHTPRKTKAPSKA